jgi:hypothetical protein
LVDMLHLITARHRSIRSNFCGISATTGRPAQTSQCPEGSEDNQASLTFVVRATRWPRCRKTPTQLRVSHHGDEALRDSWRRRLCRSLRDLKRFLQRRLDRPSSVHDLPGEQGTAIGEGSPSARRRGLRSMPRGVRPARPVPAPLGGADRAEPVPPRSLPSEGARLLRREGALTAGPFRNPG